MRHDTETPDIETASAGYASRFAGPVGAYLLGLQAAAASRLLPEWSPGLALEVGGGHGQLTQSLLDRGYTIVVQGSAPACFDRLRPLAEAHPGRISFAVSSLWSYPFADETFDLVCAVRLLGHVERWRALLKEMARVCRRQLIVEFPAGRQGRLASARLLRFKTLIEGNTRPYFLYRTSDVAAQIADLGFGQVATARVCCFPFLLHRLAHRRSLSRTAETLARRLGLTELMGNPLLMSAERIQWRAAGRSLAPAAAGWSERDRTPTTPFPPAAA